MNASGIAAVVLAVSGERTAWEARRFTEPVCGMSALARVRRALAAAGIAEVSVLTDDLAEVAGAAAWSSVLRLDLHDAPAVPSDRCLLVVCGDLPLLSGATLSAFCKAFASGRARRLVESTGVLALFRAGADAARGLAAAASAFDDSDGPFGRGTWVTDVPDDVRRLASPAAYPDVSACARERILAALAEKGVLLTDPARTYVDEGVEIGEATILFPGSHVRGGSRVGSGCRIGPDAWIDSSVVEDGAVVRYSVLEGARVRERSTIGPYAHLRHGSDVGPDARVGNFVEVKAARLGPGVKAGHLSYLGDADVGAGTNIGAGTITCNFDGAAKHRTVIEDDVFVGSNVSLVAPVTIGRGAVIGAGSTITEDVPPETLAIARARQVIKERNKKPSREDT